MNEGSCVKLKLTHAANKGPVIVWIYSPGPRDLVSHQYLVVGAVISVLT